MSELTPMIMPAPSDRARQAVPGTEPYRALYLHLPFCVKRCAYCDFPTEAIPRDDPRIDETIESLCISLRRHAKAGELAAIETVYIGGGTPTHVGSRRLSMLLYTLGVSLTLTNEMEVTIEANPESLTSSLVKDLYALGVNRLSIGVQSFDDDVLATLGRAHSADDAKRAVEAAFKRFTNVSIDLMGAIPGQTFEGMLSSVNTAVSLGIPHLSVYPLSVEPHTVMERRILAGELKEWDEDAQAAMLEAVASELTAAGLARYEVASFAKPGFACRHNQAYWSGTPYLGLGRAAVSMRQGSTWRERSRDGVIIERLNQEQMLAEDLMLAMRTSQGIGPELLVRARRGLGAVDTAIEEIVGLGLAAWREGRVVPTDRGFLLGNELYGRLLDLAP